jgi:serine/threonine protein kinase
MAEGRLIAPPNRSLLAATSFTTGNHLLRLFRGLMNPTEIKLNERYVIEKELGRGGMGIVYLARDTRLHSVPVVIKTMLEARGIALNDPWFSEKFEKEIQALVRIKHHGVVGVTDLGQMPDGRPFFVMEYVVGENLKVVMRGQPMELRRAADIIRQVGSALGAAHDVGVTHRDLKPQNVMLQTLNSGEEIVKLIDFGIATVKDLQAKQTDQETRVAGTLPYISPEQLRGEPIPASDIWSLGVIAYEMITGHLPFPANNVLVLADMQRAGVTTMPKALRPELPIAAQEVILKALNYNPAGRYRHAPDMGEEFLRTIMETQELTSISETTVFAQTSPQTPVDGHVLFMDLVGFSKLPMDEQDRLLDKLHEIVRDAPAFKRAQSSKLIEPLPTGDGMALVFFQNPVAPVQCALEIARGLKDHPDVKLRMGVHSGPIYRRLDINENMNVLGGGINFAQRVMDSGDAGHILVSRSVADNLIQLGDWQQHLHDLGEHEVKHGVVHLFNLCKGELGCPNWPVKLSPRPVPSSLQPLEVLFQRCRELFESFDEFGSPETLRPLFRLRVELGPSERCVGRAVRIDFDQFIDCLYRSGRDYRGQALVDLLELLAFRYKDDHRRKVCEDLRDSLRQLFTQPSIYVS